MNHSRTQNMLLGIAIGDTFGAGYEFAFPKISQFRDVNLNEYATNPKKMFNQVPGNYTDDTQMSIAVCEALLSGKVFSRELLAEYFVSCYKRDQKVGYAKGFKSLLDSVSDGKELLEKIKPDSIRNGAAMRSVPLGLIKNKFKVIEYAKINASVTHNTAKGIASSVVVALESHYNFHKGRNAHYETEIYPHIKSLDYETASYLFNVSKLRKLDLETILGEHKNSGVPCDGMRTVGAMVYLLDNFRNPLDIIVNSVRFGGDTDSVAAISLGINLMNRNVSELPSWMLKTLNNEAYGCDYLIDLGKKLESIR